MMMMRKVVLLIQPPILTREGAQMNAFYPLGLAYLSGYLKRHVPDVSPIILDALAEGFPNQYRYREKYIIHGLDLQDIEQAIRDVKPSIVGINCNFTNQHDIAVHVAEAAKAVSNDIVTVIGGSHASAVPAELLESDAVDIVCRGPSEKTFANVVRCVLARGSLRDIPSIAYRDGDGACIVRPLQPPAMDINDIPFPDYESLQLEKYRKLYPYFPTRPAHDSVMPLLTARGCPYNCTFCYVSRAWGKTITHRSLDNIRQELMYLRDLCEVEELHIVDDNFGFFTEETMRFIDEAKKFGIKKIVPFSGSTLKALNNPSFLDKLSEIGIEHLRIYPESGSPDTLKRMKKPQNVQLLHSAMDAARQRGFLLYGHFILGFPWQTLPDMVREIDLAKGLGVDYHYFSALNALPGTSLYEECRSAGHLASEVNYADFNLNHGNISTNEFSNWDVEWMAKQAYIETNFSSERTLFAGMKIFNTSMIELKSRKDRAEFFMNQISGRALRAQQVWGEATGDTGERNV